MTFLAEYSDKMNVLDIAEERWQTQQLIKFPVASIALLNLIKVFSL